MTPTQAAQQAVRDLVQATGWLADALQHGTERPYQPQPSDEKRAERRAQVHAERITAGTGADSIVPLGASPAPLDLDVMDLLVAILDTAVTLSDSPEPASSFTDPRPYLRTVIARLRSGQADPDAVQQRCDDLLQAAHAQLGLFGDGQLLKAVCPFCQGRTAKHPTGGAHTLRVRAQLPAGQRNVTVIDPKDVTWLVVCESQRCGPESKDVGHWWRGLPAWISSEWEWLAQRIERDAEEIAS